MNFLTGSHKKFPGYPWIRSGPGNQTKERPGHELFARAFRNKNSICESCLFWIHKKKAKFMNFSFWPFLWFGLPGRLLTGHGAPKEFEDKSSCSNVGPWQSSLAMMAANGVMVNRGERICLNESFGLTDSRPTRGTGHALVGTIASFVPEEIGWPASVCSAPIATHLQDDGTGISCVSIAHCQAHHFCASPSVTDERGRLFCRTLPSFSKSLHAWNYYFRIFRGLQLQLSGVFRINSHYGYSFLVFLAKCSYRK